MQVAITQPKLCIGRAETKHVTETLKNRLSFSPGLIKVQPGIYNLFFTGAA